MENETIMKPEMVDELLDDIGFNSPEVREATRQYCLKLIDFGGMEYGTLNCNASSFVDGYEACLNRS